MSDPFYIGYEPKAQPAIARFVRRAAFLLGAVFILVALALVSGQSPAEPGAFEFGVLRPYEGELAEWPSPMLIDNHGVYLLVGTGKFGIGARIARRQGQRARFQATLIERDGTRMLQVDSGPIEFLGGGPSQIERADLGAVTLSGEIVDTKCYLGVMKPGHTKVHRDCAARCISGGVPPGFLVRDGAGETHVLLLVGSDGRQIGKEVLDYVAEPVSISGRLVQSRAGLVLEAEPRDFRRL